MAFIFLDFCKDGKVFTLNLLEILFHFRKLRIYEILRLCKRNVNFIFFFRQFTLVEECMVLAMQEQITNKRHSILNCCANNVQ